MLAKDSYRSTVGSSLRLTGFLVTIIRLMVNGEKSLHPFVERLAGVAHGCVSREV